MEFTVLSSEALSSGNYSVHIQSIAGIVAGYRYWIQTIKELTEGETIELDMDQLIVVTKETKSGKTVRLLMPR